MPPSPASPALAAGAATEAELADALVEAMRAAGGDQAGWPPIVAAGPNAARPHHQTGDGPVGDGLLLLDYGCLVDGYHSDMTRTVWLDGEPDDELRKHVRRSPRVERGGNRRRPPRGHRRRGRRGVPGGSPSPRARGPLPPLHGSWRRARDPRGARRRGASPRTSSSRAMCSPSSPGVYVPGVGGVRIEDMVAVTDAGHEVLTSHRRSWPSMISTNDIRPGMALNLDDGLYAVIEHQHVKPGKGKAFVRMKLRSLGGRRRGRPHLPGGGERRAGPHRPARVPVPLSGRPRVPLHGRGDLRPDRGRSRAGRRHRRLPGRGHDGADPDPRQHPARDRPARLGGARGDLRRAGGEGRPGLRGDQAGDRADRLWSSRLPCSSSRATWSRSTPGAGTTSPGCPEPS